MDFILDEANYFICWVGNNDGLVFVSKCIDSDLVIALSINTFFLISKRCKCTSLTIISINPFLKVKFLIRKYTFQPLLFLKYFTCQNSTF